MIVQENLLGVTEHFFTPDIITKISEIVGQTSEKTLVGLKSIVPIFIGGLVDKGSTPEGAANLVDLINTHNFEQNVLPNEASMHEGADVLHNIFGKNLDLTLSRLSAQTNMDSTSLQKIMGLVAPICMGIIGGKIKRQSMNLTGFMSFIKDQKKLLSGYSHQTSEYYSLSGRDPEIDYAKPKDKPIWQSWIWAIILAGALMAWWDAVQYKSPATDKAIVTTVTSAPIAVLGDFLENPKAIDLPKRFYFDEIYFLGESTRLAGGFNEIKYVAEILKAHPRVKVELVGIGENVGTDKETIIFANRRADLVRNELIARGAKPEQIITRGMANAGPAGSRASTPGNASYQKMELVVTSF